MLRTRSKGTVAAVALALLASLVVGPSVAAAPILPDPGPEDVTAVASLTKTASVSQVAPGETFSYTLTVGCSSITDTGCRGAVLSDVIPAPFVLVDAVVGGGANTAAPPVITGNTLTVDWTTPLGDGTTGLLDATTGVVDVFVQLPADTSYDVSDIEVVNQAAIEGVNFIDVLGQVGVTPVIPLSLATEASKSLSPPSVVAIAGAAVTATLGGTNTSNATVESLVIQDPVDPTAAPSPFETLGFTGFGAVSAPEGTASTAFEVFVAGAWIEAPGGALPGGVPASDVRGTRVTFTGSIPAGAAASVILPLELTDAAAEQPDQTSVPNSASSTVGLGDETASDDAAATVTLLQNDVQVGVTKQFSPDLVIAGEPSTVTIEATNASAVPLDSVTITEPSAGVFAAEYAFTEFTAPVAYPAGAISGYVQYRFGDGTTEQLPLVDGDIPSGPVVNPTADVTSFDIVFEGEAIVPGAQVEVAFAVLTDGDLTGLPLTVPNEVSVTGTSQGASGSSTAQDDLFIYDEIIEPYISKQIRPDSILAVPGQVATVSLAGGLTERPTPPTQPTGSTGDAAQIVIQDPSDPVPADPWWNAFDLTAVTQSPVPADSEVTIEYYDTADDTWKTLAGPIAGPTILSLPVPGEVQDVAGGIRFVYDYTGAEGGFPPGTDLAPNFTSELRATGRYEPGPPFSDANTTLVANCAQSGATSSTVGVAEGSADIPDPCPEIELVPPVPGGGDLIDKAFGTSSSGGLKSVIARSGDRIPSTLSWSTGGYSGLERVEITDVADPATTPIADSVFDAFNLTRVQPITPANDPLIAFDQVQEVLLYDGTAWVTASNSPCPAGCIGRFPGMNLTAGEQLTTTGVRLVLVESPDRDVASAGDLDAPPVGSGVARALGNTRPITLVWQVRDETRSTSTAVLGDETYNQPAPGMVRNTANVAGFPAGGGAPFTADDVDDVVIVDVPLTTTTDKSWEGGPLAVPPDAGVFPSGFPLSRVSVTTRNTTPARVDNVIITDPAPGSVTDPREDPFNAFLLFRFVTITAPPGTTSTTVSLGCPDGSSETLSAAEALALTSATLPCDVTGFTVAFDGRIAAGSAGVVTLDLRLRDFWRGTTDRVAIADSPISNTAQGVVADVDLPGVCPPTPGERSACDLATATIALEAPSFDVVPGKTISPTQQKENVFTPVTVTLQGQPAGSLRIATMTLEDDDASFWNAFDFVGMSPTWSLPAPVEVVTACYLTGGDFSPANVVDGTVGGEWTCSPSGTLPEAETFIEDAPATLHGVRFTLAQANGLGWSNPQNPVVSVPFLVERRTALRSGDPVPTTRSDQVPAPGETSAGVFVDTMSASGTSVEITPGNTVTATETADADYSNLHLTAEVSVVKSPNGDVPPATVIPFTLAFTNTGEAPLTDPVFTDRLPVDGQGSRVILDPDRDPSVSPYGFALSGPAPTPPNGGALPTDPAEVVVEETGEAITFRMPSGSVLEPGQTYTITVPLVLRPGLTPADDVQNFAAIGAFEPFDECTPSLDTATGECIDDAIVSPLAVPALSTVKYVKADAPHGQAGIPEVLSVKEGFSCDGQATDEGSYRSPCVPVTLPGATETWSFTVTNAGTLPLDRVVSIDNLPAPGDQGIIVPLPRGSEWPVEFVAGGSLTPTATTPAGATLTTFWSPDETPCAADLNPLGTPCAPGAWEPLTAGTDLSAVRSLKFDVDFPDDLLMPGNSLQIQFQTRTTPSELTSTDFPIAWNTVSTGGSALSGAQPILVPPTEGRRVGVAYPTGAIQVVKTVTGPGADFAPDEFPVQLECTSAGNPLTGEPTLVLIAGDPPQTVEGLPWGAACTVIEGDNGQTSEVIGTAIVGGPADPAGVVTVQNIFDVGTLDVTKRVIGAALDEQGQPIVYGPFDFAAACEFLGSTVYADGYDLATPMESSLSDAETWSLSGLPVGAECTVTETDAAGALTTTYVVSEGEEPAVPVFDDSADVTVGPGSSTEVVVANIFEEGSLTLNKVVDAPAGAEFAAGPFVMRVTCTFPEIGTVYDGDVTLGGDEPLTASIADIPSGSTCEVTETDGGGANRVEITGSPAVIDSESPVVVTVTNTFLPALLSVTKQIEGDGAALYGAGPFEVLLECVIDGPDGPREVVVSGGAARSLDATNGYTASYDPLLVGSTCTLRETQTGGATSSTVDGGASATIDVVEGESTVALVNTFDVGTIDVKKTVSGSDADTHRNDTFEITATCVRDVNGVSTPVDVPGGATRPLTVSESVLYEDLPVGAVCTIEETDAGGASAVTMSPAGNESSTALVTVSAGGAAAISIDNRFDPGLAFTGVAEWTPRLVALLGAGLLVIGIMLLWNRRRRSRG